MVAFSLLYCNNNNTTSQIVTTTSQIWIETSQMNYMYSIAIVISNIHMKVIYLRKVHRDIHVTYLRIVVDGHNLLLLLLAQEKKDKILRNLEGVWKNQNLTNSHPKHPK